MNNEKRGELYSQFYNPAKAKAVNVELCTIEELVQWEEALELVILQAKAEQRGYSDGRREREAGLSKEERAKLITRPDMSVSEGINVPKVRKDRMSGKDKLAAEFATYVLAGTMSQEDADVILGTVRVDEKPKTIVQQTAVTGVEKPKPANDSSFSFNKKDKDEDEPKVAPFNPAKITQESLLADLLSNVNLESNDLKRLTETYNTAALLVGKTVNKLQPDKMILLGSRIAELTELKKAADEAARIAKEIKKTETKEPSTSTGTLAIDESKLFG